MAVISFKEIHNGRSYSSRTTSGGSVETYHRTWRAETDNRYDNGDVVTAHLDCPRRGQPFPTNPFAFCRDVEARNQGFSKLVWIVTGVYSTAREITDDPLNDPADIKWRTEQGQKVFYRDKNDEIVTNSAGDEFDPPPMIDDSHWLAMVTKNLAAVPLWFLAYQDAINSVPFELDGVPLGARQAKMQAIEISSWQYRDQIPYRVVAMSIATTKGDFRHRELDRGFNEKVTGTPTERQKCRTDKGEEVTSPAMLDGNGYQLADPSPSNAVALTFDGYDELDFNNLPLI